jgi:hypothetical protein
MSSIDSEQNSKAVYSVIRHFAGQAIRNLRVLWLAISTPSIMHSKIL